MTQTSHSVPVISHCRNNLPKQAYTTGAQNFPPSHISKTVPPHRSTRPTRIQPVRSNSFSDRQLHIDPALATAQHNASPGNARREPPQYDYSPNMSAAPASKQSPVKRCNATSDTTLLIANHLPFPRVRSAQQQNTIIFNTAHLRNFFYLILSCSRPDASTRPTQTKLVRSHSRRASHVMLPPPFLAEQRCIDKTDPDKTGKVTQSTSIPCHASHHPS